MATPLNGYRSKIATIAVCQTNELVYAGTESGELLIWSFRPEEGGGNDVLCLEASHQIHYDRQSVHSLAVAHDGTVYSLSTGVHIGDPAGIHRPTIVTFSYTANTVGTFTSFEALVASEKPTAMAVTPDGWLFTGHANGEIKIWSEGECTRTMSHHSDAITRLIPSNFGSVFSGSQDGRIQVYSSRGRRVRVLDTEPHPVVALGVSLTPDIYTAVDGSNVLRVW